MEEVIHYLELKNQYYEKFHAMTAKFLASAAANQWEDLELFVDNRERILNIIRSYDFKIAQRFEQVDIGDCNLDVYRGRVQGLLHARKAWADKIVSLDLELISRIDEMKCDTIRELKRTLQTNQQVSSFEETALATAPAKEV